MIAIIDYGMGNAQSVKNALELLGYEAEITRDEKIISSAEKLILPGVGAFRDGMKSLEKLGLIQILNREVLDKKKPIIGICLGMQLLGKDSEESRGIKGLGWIDGHVKKLGSKEKSKGIKIPHVGWDNITITRKDKLLAGVADDSDFYFVHSYHLAPKDKEVMTSSCEYGERFAATIQEGNVYGAQFHPEKSQSLGLKILENFVEHA